MNYMQHEFTQSSMNNGYSSANNYNGGYSAPQYSSQQYAQNYYSNSTSTTGYGSKYDDDKNGKAGASSFKSKIDLHNINNNVLMWAGFVTVSVFVYFTLSGGDFSFLVTYGSLARLFAFGILNAHIFTNQSVAGVSAKTLQLFTAVFGFRLISIMGHEGYLPYDKSGDWLYHLVEGSSLMLAGLALFSAMAGPFKHTYKLRLDSFGGENGIAVLAAIIFFISVFIHPNLNQNLIGDISWTFAMYLESAALAPQLEMFAKQSKNGSIDQLLAHFVFALGFGRVMDFLFWMYSHTELQNASGSCLPGYLAVVSQIVQVLLMSKFFYGYFVSIKNSTPMKLPSSDGPCMMV